MFFTYQHVISSLFSAFREFIGDVSPLRTYTRAHTQRPINFFLLWQCTSSTIEYILFFLFASINHMQHKKISSLVDISNFSKTKGSNANQAKAKNKRKRQFHLEPKNDFY